MCLQASGPVCVRMRPVMVAPPGRRRRPVRRRPREPAAGARRQRRPPDPRARIQHLHPEAKKLGLADSARRFADASDSEDADGRTALYRAARADDAPEVRRLLEARADPNFRQRYRRTTPLHAAAYYGFPDAARALLAAGARADVRNEFGRTALEEAEAHPEVAVMIRLSTMRGRDRGALLGRS